MPETKEDLAQKAIAEAVRDLGQQLDRHARQHPDDRDGLDVIRADLEAWEWLQGVARRAAEAFDCWAVLELFGHKQVVGHVTEARIGSGRFLRVEVPATDELPAMTKYYGTGAVFGLHVIEEELAMKLVESVRGGGWGDLPVQVPVTTADADEDLPF